VLDNGEADRDALFADALDTFFVVDNDFVRCE